MLTQSVLLSVVAATQLNSMLEEQSEIAPCGGDIISKPVCTDDKMINNCSFQGGEKYVDAGCSDIAINDSDCTNHAKKFVDTTKCTNIVRDNR